jgi:hypothetical protein
VKNAYFFAENCRNSQKIVINNIGPWSTRRKAIVKRSIFKILKVRSTLSAFLAFLAFLSRLDLSQRFHARHFLRIFHIDRAANLGTRADFRAKLARFAQNEKKVLERSDPGCART